MARYFGWAVLVLALPLALTRADGDAKKTAPREGEVVAHYHDGTRVRTQLMQDTIDVVTKYGKLTVPTKDIRRIEFGFRLSDEAARKLDAAVKDLTSNNFQARENATKDLVALGRMAYPALLKAAKDNDLDTTRRVEDVLKAIRDKVPGDQLRSRTDDLVFTTDFTIAGRIDTTTLKAKTQHFGEVQLRVVDLRSMESTIGGGETKVTVDAVTFGSNANQWMDTRFMVNPDVKLLLTASGEVDLYGNQQPGQYISGPDGNRNVGRFGAHMPGMLLGRIGEDGPVFVVGKQYEGTPTQEGKLYLRIVPIQGSGGSTGHYQVKIKSGTN